MDVPLLRTDEPYILSPDEEAAAIQREIVRLKYDKIKSFVKRRYGNIQERIEKINFEELIDRPEVLRKANLGKQRQLWQAECEQRWADERKQRILDYQKLMEKCNAEYFLELLKKTSKDKFGKDFVMNEKNGHFVSAVIYFVCRDPRFETELNYDFAKGLLLRGKSGIGKTFIIKCIQENERIPIHINSLITITKILKAKGEFEISKGVLNLLDDVGTEVKKVNHFGTEIFWFKNFIEERYLEVKDYSDLIISSNNNFAEMEEMYGYRARRRIEDDMFNVVNVVDFR